jgi:hypothetical protein
MGVEKLERDEQGDRGRRGRRRGTEGIVTDKGNGGQPACLEEWKKCKEEHE